MVAVGVDTHKDTLAACAIDGIGRIVGERMFTNEETGLS